MKTFLVTGGAGFIGSHFIEGLLNSGDSRVVNLDKLTYAGSLKNLEFAKGNDNYSFFEGDICNQATVGKLFEAYDFDCVVNFAAESHVDRSIYDSAPFIQTNVAGVRVLLDAAKKHWNDYEGKRFIQVSTDEVYGSLEEDDFADEESPLRPGNPYAASKAAADLLVLSYYNTYELPVLITRCCNNFGPRQYKEKFIPVMIDCLFQGNKLPLYGQGLNKREWIHVRDHCRILAGVIESGASGEIYNIGSGIIRRNIDIALELIRLFNELTGKCLDESVISYVADRKGHDFRYALNNSKVSRLLSLAPLSDQKQNLKELILNSYKKVD